MTLNFNRQVRLLKLWQFIDNTFSVQKVLLQSEILRYCQNHDLGSKKTILLMLNEFIENKMIKETMLAPRGPGRPKKAYIMPQKREEETILINLGVVPLSLYDFITHQTITQKIGKSEAIIQLLTWAYLQYQNGLNSEKQIPKKPLPPHLKPMEIKRDSLRSI